MKPGDGIHYLKSELAKLQQARQSVERVRLKLLSPSMQALDSSACDIAEAVESLKKLESELTSGRRRTPEWRRALEFEVRSLQQDLREVNALLAAAGQFYLGWARLVSTGTDDAPANYTPRGTTHPDPCDSPKVVQIG